MHYNRTSVETPVAFLPPNIITSLELEERLAPTYDSIGLHAGRLELMTGIRERRFWDHGTLPSTAAAEAGKSAIESAGLRPDQINCLINCSVSRDCVEPATSTFVHHLLNLSSDTLNFDISNACLGVASGILTLASMIEAGFIDTGLAVSGENAEPLVNNTIEHLNHGQFTRQTIKPHFASLTIGSCATAIIVRRSDQTATGHRLFASAIATDTSCNNLCKGDANGGMTDDSTPLMQTDSPELLQAGVKLACTMWEKLKSETDWEDNTPDLICTHQVGKGHRSLLYEKLHLNLDKDYSTFPFLGNCGSASLTATLAMAAKEKEIAPKSNVALLGIGSGINCCGLAIQW